MLFSLIELSRCAGECVRPRDAATLRDVILLPLPLPLHSPAQTPSSVHGKVGCVSDALASLVSLSRARIFSARSEISTQQSAQFSRRLAASITGSIQFSFFRAYFL